MSTFGAGPSSSNLPPYLTSSNEEPTRPQAEPLPRKVAEFGYVPTAAAFGPSSSSNHNNPNASVSDLALRPHPAERPSPGSAEQISGGTNTSASADPVRPSHGTNPAAGASTSSLPTLSSIDSRTKRKVSKVINFLRGRNSSSSSSLQSESIPMPLIWGIELPTMLRLIFTVVILIGVIVGWAVTIMIISKHDDHRNSENGDNTNDGAFGAGQSTIFIHTGFGVVTLILLVLLERAVFIARADRYAFKHPNSASPYAGRRGRNGSRGNVAFAPWNRPSLPTYANAVGFRGTGDVEDAQIAGAPPPEYGNTRGSTLLLSTFFNTNPIPGSSAAEAGRGAGAEEAEDPRGRPVSYMSQVGVPATTAAAPTSALAVPERAASRLSNLSVEDDARRAMMALDVLESEDRTPSATRLPPPVSLRPIRR